MAFIKHGSFVTLVPALTVDFYVVPFQGDLDLHPSWRNTEQGGTDGEFARETGKPGREFIIEVTGDGSAYTNLKTQEKKSGTLTIRGDSATVKLKRVERVGGLGANPTVSAGVVTGVTYDYMQCICTFFRES